MATVENGYNGEERLRSVLDGTQRRAMTAERPIILQGVSGLWYGIHSHIPGEFALSIGYRFGVRRTFRPLAKICVTSHGPYFVAERIYTLFRLLQSDGGERAIFATGNMYTSTYIANMGAEGSMEVLIYALYGKIKHDLYLVNRYRPTDYKKRLLFAMEFLGNEKAAKILKTFRLDNYGLYSLRSW